MLSNAQTTDSSKSQLERLLRYRAAAEMAVTLFLLEIAIWNPSPLARMIIGATIFALIIRIYTCYATQAERQTDKPKKSGLTIVLASMAIALLVCGIFYGLDLWSPVTNLFSQRSLWDWTTVKIPTVVLQQLLFQLVFIPALYFITSNAKKTVLISATVFGLLHLPNPMLMVCTFLVGLAWFSLSVFRPRLIPITVSHLLLAVVIASVADEYVLDMRVGQACFQKWPSLIQGQTDQKSLTVYPRVIEGAIRSVTQEKTDVWICGNAYDGHRAKPPTTVYAVLGNFDPTDQEGKSWNPQHITSTSNIGPEGNFRLTLNSNRYASATEIRLFARHQTGWCYPVNGSARFEIHASDFIGERVCLYPKSIQGNIGHTKHRANRTDLVGWGFQLEPRQLIDSILVLHRGKTISIKPERRPRKEIANYFSDPNLLECGLVMRIPMTIELDQAAFYVRNSRGTLERLPVNLKQAADQQLANRRTNPVR
ncbi:MAG: CPBP family intramembrane glutamic endopeptidase [Planctomycetota bacterium]|nr:CPBP family intramembrane glutamic endopeptidase [Planctomycetota bacterium]